MADAPSPGGPRIGKAPQSGPWIVGCDLTGHGLQVAQRAAEEAKRAGAPLVVAHVLDPYLVAEELDWTDEGVASIPWPAHLAHSEGLSEDRLEAVCASLREAFEGLEVSGRVVQGRPGDAMVDLADEVDARRLVVGTHARTGLKRWILGSVAAWIVGHAHRPVLVIPFEERYGPG